MLQEAQLEQVVRDRPAQIAEMRAFLSLAGIPVLQASALPTVVARVEADRAFRRDLTSHLWVWMADVPEPGYAELLAMLAVSAAGLEAAAADGADAHALLRLLMETRRAFAGGAAKVVEEPVMPAKAAPAVTVLHGEPRHGSARTAMVATAVLTLLVLLVAGMWLHRRTAAVAPASTAAPIAAEPAPAYTPAERKPDEPVDTEPATAGERDERATVLADKGRGVARRERSVVEVRRTGSAEVDRLTAATPPLAEPPVAAPVTRMPASSLPTSVPAGNLPQVVARARGGAQAPVPAGVLSDRLGARTLPAYADTPEYSGPWRPRLLRRTPSSASGTQLAELQPVERPAGVRAGAGQASGTVRPTALGMMAGNVVYSPSPAYPSAASQARVQGEVRIEAQVDRDGNVSYARVVSGPPLLREAALDAVQHWRYKPWVAGGRAMPMTTMAVLAFELP